MNETTTGLPNAGHQDIVNDFADKLRASNGAICVWFNKDDCMWHVRAKTPDGMLDLSRPSGKGWTELKVLLQVLAGAGIKDTHVEFDGIPTLRYDRLNQSGRI
jgi:hypothetical protein